MESGKKEPAAMRTDKYIITKTKANEGDVPFLGTAHMPNKDVRERVLYLDDEVIKGAFYVATTWFWEATGPGPQAHVHDFPEVLGFFGTNPEDSHDLGGEVELWIDGEKHVLTQTFLAYIPGGMKHCPLQVVKLTRPMFHFSTGPKSMYGGNQK
jgi:hypothetical protein